MDDFAAVDEVHEHATPDIIQKLNTATGAPSTGSPVASVTVPWTVLRGLSRNSTLMTFPRPGPGSPRVGKRAPQALSPAPLSLFQINRGAAVVQPE